VRICGHVALTHHTVITLGVARFAKDHFSATSLLVSIALINLLILLPYFKWHSPIGWDTPTYMHYPRYVEKYGVASTFTDGVIDRPGYALFLYMLCEAGVSLEQLLITLSSLFGSFYVVSTYLLLKESSDNGLLASLAALLSSCSLATVRLANDLQPHLFALGLMMLSMHFQLTYTNRGNRRYIIFLAISGLLMLLVHPFTYMAYIVILLFYSFAGRLEKRPQELTRETIGTVACFLPLAGAALFSLLISLRPIAALAENLLNPSMISPPASQLWVGNAVIQIIPLFAFSMIGFIRLLQVEEGRPKRMLLAWTVPFSLATLLALSLGVTFAYRFILILPLPILAAYGFRIWSSAHQKRLRYILFAAVIVLNFSIATAHQLEVEPSIDERLRDELVWVRDNLGNKFVVPVYPLDLNKGNWVLGLAGDYVYYGEVMPLLARKPENYPSVPNLDPSIYWKRLEDDDILKNLSEYQIVLVDGLYRLDVFDEQIAKKVVGHDIYIIDQLVAANETEINFYYEIWRRFKDTKVAVIGKDRLVVRDTFYDLWIPPVPTWIATPDNIQCLVQLPVGDDLFEYDALILADWAIGQNETVAERLLEYFMKDRAVITISRSVYDLYVTAPQTVEFIFGIEEAYPPNATYSSITYRAPHFVTSDFSLPLNGTKAEYGVPVSNLTTAQGIATVTSSDELYLLIVNQRNNTRAAHLGLSLSQTGEIDITIFKSLLLWVLHLETYRK